MSGAVSGSVAARGELPWRTLVGLGAVAAAAILSLLQTTHGGPRSAGAGLSDPVSVTEARLAPLRSILPPRAVVGYVSDAASADGREEFRRYLLAQYVLAPVIVIDSTEPELVIGDFTSAGSSPEVHGLQPVWGGGTGVVLLARPTR